MKKISNKTLKNIKILDCTLRDGGYYNSWDFDENLIKQYLTTIKKSNISDIEIGFRFFDKDYFLGALAYTTDEFLKRLTIQKKINLCVMVNSSDFINYKSRSIDNLFSEKKKSRVNTIRFATHFREVKSIIKHLKRAKKLNYKVIVNLMQANDRSEKEIKNVIQELNKANCVSVLYFADSLGRMEPSEISDLYETTKKYWKKDLGIHTHDNKGLSLQNSLEAIKSGVKYIDSTILGMGRGAGNVQTEILLAEFQSLKSKKYNIEPIYELSEGIFLDLKKKYNWGKSLNYHLAANYNIHPTYIQTLENDPRYSKKKIYETINYLKNVDSRSYNKEKLKNVLDKNQKNYKGTWNSNNWCKNKNVLLIGPGKSVERYKVDIENIIKTKKALGISLNINEIINNKFISYYISSNENRIMVDINKYSKIKKPIILPYKRVKSLVKNFKSKKIKDYGLKIDSQKIIVNKNYCSLPNSLVFGYAMALCLSGRCKKIYLAGFDGYNVENPQQEEMLNLIKIFKKQFPKLDLISLTPTSYPIKKLSVYAKNL